MTDARDAEQLSKNKVTHILSVHDSARPMLEVRVLICAPICAVLLGAGGGGGVRQRVLCSSSYPGCAEPVPGHACAWPSGWAGPAGGPLFSPSSCCVTALTFLAECQRTNSSVSHLDFKDPFKTHFYSFQNYLLF